MLATELIAGFIADREDAKLFDIGIGTAQQEVAVLRELGRRVRAPRRLHFIALEPNPSTLAEAQQNLRQVAEEVGVEIVVQPLAKLAEVLSEHDWDQRRQVEG